MPRSSHINTASSTRERHFAPNVTLNTYKMPLEVKPRVFSRMFRQNKKETRERSTSLEVINKLTANREMSKHMPLPRRKLPKKIRPTHESFKKLHVNLKSVDIDEASVENMIVQQDLNPQFAANLHFGPPLAQKIKRLRELGFNWSVVQSQIITEFASPLKGKAHSLCSAFSSI